MLIPLLGVGGSIISETGRVYLLDTGYQIVRRNNGTFHIPPSFKSYSRKYVKNTRSSVQRDLAEGRIAQEFLHSHEVVTQLANSLCLSNKELRQMKHWLFKSFPDTASQYLFPEPGKLLEPVGEALLLHACKPISNYVIFWNQTYNGSCYPNFPVVSPDLPKVYYLELNQRRLVAQGH